MHARIKNVVIKLRFHKITTFIDTFQKKVVLTLKVSTTFFYSFFCVSCKYTSVFKKIKHSLLLLFFLQGILMINTVNSKALTLLLFFSLPIGICADNAYLSLTSALDYLANSLDNLVAAPIIGSAGLTAISNSTNTQATLLQSLISSTQDNSVLTEGAATAASQATLLQSLISSTQNNFVLAEGATTAASLASVLDEIVTNGSTTDVTAAILVTAKLDSLVTSISQNASSSDSTLGSASTTLATMATMLKNAAIQNGGPTNAIVSRIGNIGYDTIYALSRNSNLSQPATIDLVVANARTIQAAMDFLLTTYSSYLFNDEKFNFYVNNKSTANNKYSIYISSPSLTNAKSYIYYL